MMIANNRELEQILKRFDTLYARLIKNQQTHFHAENKLTIQDQIKLCKSLAKSESLVLLEGGNED